MKAYEINFPKTELIELISDDGSEFDQKIGIPSEVSLHYESSTDSLVMTLDGNRISVKGSDERNHDILSKIGERNLPKICWLVSQFVSNENKSSVMIQVHEFPITYSWEGEPSQFGVDEKILDQIRKKMPRKLENADLVMKWLTQETIIEPSSPHQSHRMIISVGPAPQGSSKTAFQIHGKTITVNVRQQEDEKLRVERIVFSKRSKEIDDPFILVKGVFSFCDISIAGIFRDTKKNDVDRLVEQADSYLNLWRNYNKLERNQILQKAKKFGYHYYESRVLLSNGNWRFNLLSSEKLLDALVDLRRVQSQDLEASLVPPSELINPGQFDLEDKSTLSGNANGKQHFIGKYNNSDLTNFTIELKPSGSAEDDIPPEEGVIHLALTGDRTRLERRDKAEMRIRSMNNPMPQLVYILLDQYLPPSRRKDEDAYSSAAADRFGGSPTKVQLEAIEIALNTPNIALIQGPPGTGKTRVIAALEVRLAEINKQRDVPGKTLLTSYQHDAVTNAAAKTVVFGLPAIKIGTKKDQYEVEDGVEEWRRNRIDKLTSELANLPDRPASQIYKQVKYLALGYLKAPSIPDQTAELLDTIAELSADYVPPDLLNQLRAVRDSLRRGYALKNDDLKEERERAINALKALRTNEQAFLDDGANHAGKTLYWLRKLKFISPEDEDLMEQAAYWIEDAPPSFLKELEDFKNRAIDYLEESAILAGIPLENENVSNLLILWCDTLYNNLRDSKDGPDSVVWEYLDDLNNDPDGVRLGIQEYTSVLAATCQQADSDPMDKIKYVEQFESVIIDEAARANPLDLFIPMAMAERRIILVGDHRQLPQVLEPEIEKMLEESVQEQTQKAIKESLFERLFKQLQRWEEKDGKRRTITLDTQFRMHPTLGDFVSRVFYEPWNEGFSSEKDEGEFIHNNPLIKNNEKGILKVAAWVNISSQKGYEKGGRSKYRIAEAEWIAKNIKEFMDADPDYTFGIISFYQGQVTEILSQLCKYDLAEISENGTPQIKRMYENRLQVDTVDAYQGKEFDVVILSITRSNDLPGSTNKELRRKYGFLMLSNRLCVAMSRQKSLLIVVGDIQMISTDYAETAIPGLVEFKKLCEGPYGKIL